MPKGELIIRTIGKIARESLTPGGRGSVFGVTSRGVFIRMHSGWVIFISFEPFRGPLTLNLRGEASPLNALRPGSELVVREGELIFPAAELAIRTKQAETWEGYDPQGTALSPAEREVRLASIAHGVAAERGPAGLGAALASVARRRLPPEILPLYLALRGRLPARISTSVEPFLGLGSGLTPSGDDLTLGLLLALNRWSKLLNNGLDMPALNREIIQAAYRRTTNLSANLIECASQGQADERLVAALDGIMTGSPDLPGCILNLLQWGSTSGGDVLVGIALAILSGNGW